MYPENKKSMLENTVVYKDGSTFSDGVKEDFNQPENNPHYPKVFNSMEEMRDYEERIMESLTDSDEE